MRLGSLFLTLPTRALTGQHVIASEGYGARRDLSWRGSAGSSPSQAGHVSGPRTTGIRLCSSAHGFECFSTPQPASSPALGGLIHKLTNLALRGEHGSRSFAARADAGARRARAGSASITVGTPRPKGDGIAQADLQSPNRYSRSSAARLPTPAPALRVAAASRPFVSCNSMIRSSTVSAAISL
jgi:hypothetical protein